jgi:preprotein translocase subunit SecE
MFGQRRRREEQAFAMNRETKRAMARQQKTADPQRLQQLRKQQLERQRAGGDGQQRGARRGGRLRGIGSFGGEVTAELRKVNWPDRRTVAAYTVVVLVAVSVITAVIFGLDTLFGKAVFAVFGD